MVYSVRVMIMPRTSRKISRSNIYHVMLRGINRQVIFENDGDRHYFLTVLHVCKEISDFRLYAFCLMSNHIHLLIEPAGEPLDHVLKRIGSRYVPWYNRKYQRTGHLFQDRYKSEAVETDQYFMTALRYILQNPMKAGMESRPGSYRWSSYLAYEKGAGKITDTQYALDLFGNREALIRFVQQDNDDSIMDETEFDWRLRDEQAQEIMREITQCPSVSAFQLLDPDLQKSFVGKLYQQRLSTQQISRLTGISKATVVRTIQKLRNKGQFSTETPKLNEPTAYTCFSDTDEIW